MNEQTTPSAMAPFRLAVIMERSVPKHPWADESWEAVGVVSDAQEDGSGERVLVSDGNTTQVLFPGFVLKLHADEAEGYLYNLTSREPKVFVLWRMSDGVARPVRLTVSYHEGARWMDAEDSVNGVALPPDLVPWIAEFARLNYRPEVRKTKRYASSKDRGVASHRDGVG